MAGVTSSLVRSYIRTCQRDIRILTRSRTGGSSRFSHFIPRFCACPKLSTCLLHSSSSENGEEKGKKTRQRKPRLKNANGDGSPADVPTATLENSLQQDKPKKSRKGTTKKKSASKGAEGDGSAGELPKQKKTRKKKEKKSPDISDGELKDSLLGPFIPFEGTSQESVVLSDTRNLHNGSFSIDRQDSLEGRLYHIIPSAGHDMATYSFPSVTTILENTVEKGSYYRLLNWKRKLTAEHGMDGFDAIVKNTLKSGSNFHKDLENKLLQEVESRTNQRDRGLTEPTEERSLHSASSSKHSPRLSKDTPTNVEDGSHERKHAIIFATEEKIAEKKAQNQTSMLESSHEMKSDESDSSNDKLDGETSKVQMQSVEHNLGDIGKVKSDESDSSSNDELDGETSKVQMLSVEHVLRDIGKVIAMETAVAHFELGYMGTFDCLAEYQGQLCLIDWKTSTRLKPSLADCYDYPLQAVAYAGAINQDPNIDLKVFNLLIVVAYASGEPAHAHLINHELCQEYWLKWLHRLQTYQTRFAEDLSEVI